MEFTVEKAFSRGWQVFKSNYGFLLGASCLFLLIHGVVGVIDDVIIDNSWASAAILALFTMPFSVGFGWVGVRCARVRGQVVEDRPGMSALFAGFGRYLPIVGIGIIGYVCTIGSLQGLGFITGNSLSFLGADGNWLMPNIGPGFAVALIVWFIFAVWISVRWMFPDVICIDPRQRDKGVMASLGGSWRATGPIFWPLLGLMVCLALIGLVSFILLVLPFIFFGMPLIMAIHGAAYTLIFDGDDAPAVTEVPAD